jgi:hypothetical protein
VYKDIMGASTEGGDMTNYYNGKDVEKAVTNFLGEMGRARTEYYFENGKLIFEFEIHKFYDRPMTGNVVRIKEAPSDCWPVRYAVFEFSYRFNPRIIKPLIFSGFFVVS